MTASIFTEPVLVVNQKAKLLEGSSEFRIQDGAGNDIGAVRQVGQSALGKILKALSNLDALMAARFEVVDASGAVQLVISKPFSLLRATVSVQRADGTEVGAIRNKIRIGKARFVLASGGADIGALNAENFRAWDFTLEDASGAKVGSINKKWAGLATEMFTNADRYAITVEPTLADPLRSLVIGAALTVDLLLKQVKS